MKDLFGKALLDYHQHEFQGPLILHNDYGDPEEIPVESYFYRSEDFSDLEIFALEHINGKTLDVGAASGRHALFLQERAVDIVAMDISPICGSLMRGQGVGKVIIEDVMDYDDERYDTVMMLMNGVGIAGDLVGLKKLLSHLENLVKPGGQILLDSTDISYLYEEKPKPGDKYFGQLSFHYEYEGEVDDPFQWLYIDQQTLIEVANGCNWNCQIIFQDETDAYLARLTQY